MVVYKVEPFWGESVLCDSISTARKYVELFSEPDKTHNRFDITAVKVLNKSDIK